MPFLVAQFFSARVILRLLEPTSHLALFRATSPPNNPAAPVIIPAIGVLRSTQAAALCACSPAQAAALLAEEVINFLALAPAVASFLQSASAKFPGPLPTRTRPA
jgi:hypothetical protein